MGKRVTLCKWESNAFIGFIALNCSRTKERNMNKGGKEGAGKTRKGGRKEEEEKEEQEEDEEAKKMQGKGNNISVLPFQRFVYHKYQTNMSVRKSNDTYEHVLASL